MRLRLTLLAFPPLLAAAAAPQQQHVLSTNLVDALSADEDYASLLRLLQRARLIPTLNQLNRSTLFAPTNDAIARHKPWQDALRDNRHQFLRQDLFYHLLNYSIHDLPNSPDSSPQVHQTLLYPRALIEGPPSPADPPRSPWFPEPGSGTLGG